MIPNSFSTRIQSLLIYMKISCMCLEFGVALGNVAAEFFRLIRILDTNNTNNFCFLSVYIAWVGCFNLLTNWSECRGYF